MQGEGSRSQTGFLFDGFSAAFLVEDHEFSDPRSQVLNLGVTFFSLHVGFRMTGSLREMTVITSLE